MKWLLNSMALLFFTLLSLKAVANTSPQGITLQGTIINPSGQPQESASVAFTIQIKSPGAEDCLLYEENHTLNMSNSAGAFSIVIGSGTRLGASFEDTSTLSQVFDNSSGTINSLSCAIGNSYSPAATHARNVIITFDDGAGPQTVSETLSVQAVAYALHSDKLQGKSAADFVQAVDGNSQTRFQSVFDTRYTELDALLNGTSNLYTGDNGANFTPTSSVNFNSQAITNLASPSNGTDAANKNYCDGNVGGKATDSATLSSLTGTDNGKVLSWNGSQWTATSVSASPGGATTQVQFNDTGSFAGDSNLVWDNTNKRLGVGQASPTSAVDVNGSVRVGVDVATCTTTNKGAIRYNTTTNMLEYCDESLWRTIAATTATVCTGPNAFSFTNLNNFALSSIAVSESFTPVGCAVPLAVSVSGSGSPEVSINNGPWVTSGVINPGESLRVRMYTSSSVNTASNAVVVIGSTTGTTWTVTTKAGNTRVFITNTTSNGNLGGMAGADSMCQTDAINRGFGGTWKAILSDSTLDANDRLIVEYPVVRATDSALVSSSNFFSGSLTNSIYSTAARYTYTGTDNNGMRSGSNFCDDWTNGSAGYGSEVRGQSNNLSGWLSDNISTCNTIYYMFCIEQPDPGCSVNAFNFTDQNNLTLNTLATSNTIVPTGCATSSEAYISSQLNNAEMSINGGAWVRRGTINPGDSLTIRATSSPNYLNNNKVSISIGNTWSSWNITTQSAPGSKIFITSGIFNGALGGLAGADAICQGEATSRGYSGTWKALLSDSSNHAKDRLTIVYPVTRAASGVIIDNLNIWDGSLQTSLTSSTYRAWTGTSTSGTGTGNYCNDWMDATTGFTASTAEVGQADSRWVADVNYGCNNVERLICVSQ